MTDILTYLSIPIAIGAAVIFILIAMSFRTVVATNEVHIVQGRRATTSYGKDQAAGNTYYAWPAWIPAIGIRIIRLPVSVFDIQLKEYAAYDKGRVPFVIDILAFFRIDDSNVAAQRVSSFEELQTQLMGILQGASRSILAQSPIEEILEERAKYGRMFTEATDEQLKAWGVVNVKNVELMDIRDAAGSQVIQRIMAVKQSLVEKDSRVAVAANQQAAQTAEIEAQQQVLLKQQDATQQVGERTAQQEQQVGIAKQRASQAIREEERTTKEKEMAVTNVAQVRAAEIEKAARVVEAEQTKATAILIAEGSLQSQKLGAEAVLAQGTAKAEAEKLMQLAGVTPQITLAKEIGENEGYQGYLIAIRKVEASQAVGIEQAKALGHADIKVISNVGTPPEGLSNVMDLFSAKGGLAIGSALEAISATPAGKAITEKLGINSNGAGARQ